MKTHIYVVRPVYGGICKIDASADFTAPNVGRVANPSFARVSNPRHVQGETRSI